MLLLFFFYLAQMAFELIVRDRTGVLYILYGLVGPYLNLLQTFTCYSIFEEFLHEFCICHLYWALKLHSFHNRPSIDYKLKTVNNRYVCVPGLGCFV